MGKKIAIGVVVVAAIFVGVGYALPGKVKVVHETVFKATPMAVFEQLNDMQKSLAWDPWAAADSTMKVKVGPIKAGVGASKSWKSEKSGNGTQTVTESIPGQSVKIDLDFGKQGKAKGWFTLKKVNGGTQLTQGFESDAGNIIGRYMMALFMNKMIKTKFAEGHANIKKIVEQGK